MAYPLGVVTRTINVGDSLTVESGTDLTVRATLRSSRGLVWVATGERAVSALEVRESAAAGDAVTFTPPVTDQAGWRDLTTGALIDVSAANSHTHTYTIELVTLRAGRPVDSRIIGPFALPTGDGSPVDADLLIEAEIVAGVLVSVPDALTPRMAALEVALDALSPGAASAGLITADDTPAAPAEGESASYFVTSAVVWPAGLEWSTDPDGGTAPTITGTALVSMFTVGGVTRAIMGATFPALPVPADTTAPSIPAGLSATATSSTTVDLAWTASTDDTAVTGYEYRVGGGAAVDAGAGVSETVTGLTASTLYSFEVRAYDAAGNRSDWSTAASATTSAPPADSTPPTVGTMAASAITATGFTLTVSGAADETALHATPYAFTTSGGTDWSAYQASPVLAVTGKTASTGYSCNWRVRDAAGNVSTGTAQTVTTGAPAEGLEGAILALSPAGYWKLDETTGTQAVDYSGNARHGTYAGTYTQAGADGYLSVSALGTITIPDADAFSALPALTIFAVYKSSNNTGRVMDKAGAQFEHKLGFTTTGRLELAVWSTTGNNAPAFVRGSTIATGAALPWQTAAATISDPQQQTSTLHRAGVAETPDRTAAGVAVYGNTTVPLTLARNLTGALAHVAIFSAALTAGQIEALHAAAVADPTVPVSA